MRNLTWSLTLILILTTSVLADKTVARISNLTNARVSLIRHDDGSHSMDFRSKDKSKGRKFVVTPAQAKELSAKYRWAEKRCKNLEKGGADQRFVEFGWGRIYFHVARHTEHPGDLAVILQSQGQSRDDCPLFYTSFEGGNENADRQRKSVKAFFSRLGMMR